MTSRRKGFAIHFVLLIFSFLFSRPRLLEVVNKLSLGISESKSQRVNSDEVWVLLYLASATRNCVSFIYIYELRACQVTLSLVFFANFPHFFPLRIA